MLRRVCALLAIWAAAAFSPASAYFPALSNGTLYTCYTGVSGLEGTGVTSYDACSTGLNAVFGPDGFNVSVMSCTPNTATHGTCWAKGTPKQSSSGLLPWESDFTYSVSNPTWCPVNSAYAGAFCICIRGYVESGSSCVAPLDEPNKPDAVGGYSQWNSGGYWSIPQGAASVVSTTACTDGICDTHVRYYDASGAALGPIEAVARGALTGQASAFSSVGSTFKPGQCGGDAPVCTGDAVQCAMTAIQISAYCAANTVPTAASSTAIATFDAAAGQSGDVSSSLPGSASHGISGASFDQSGALGAGAGLIDREISIMGVSVSVPFSVLNVWLERFGLLLQGITFLACVGIVYRAAKA
jgi:hypothetical protein